MAYVVRIDYPDNDDMHEAAVALDDLIPGTPHKPIAPLRMEYHFLTRRAFLKFMGWMWDNEILATVELNDTYHAEGV